jgi:hypothetical protein
MSRHKELGDAELLYVSNDKISHAYNILMYEEKSIVD